MKTIGKIAILIQLFLLAIKGFGIEEMSYWVVFSPMIGLFGLHLVMRLIVWMLDNRFKNK